MLNFITKHWEKFRTARAKGYRVIFHWLWTRACVLYREIITSDESFIKSHVIVWFLHHYNIRMCSQQQNKKKNTEDKISGLQKWYSTFCESFI